MPFTPFHLGVGALVKAALPSRAFSFQAFFLSQVLIDIQPGLGLLLNWDELHGWTHTYPGALVIAAAAFLVWRAWEKVRPERYSTVLMSNLVLGWSALFGTLSHVWMDSQFHAEMVRITPSHLMLWKTGDVTTQIETFCIGAAMLALLIYIIRCLALALWKRYRNAVRRPADQVE